MVIYNTKVTPKKAYGLWDYASGLTSEASKDYPTSNSKSASRKLTDMYKDKSWNIVSTYSDWTKRVTDSKWNLISDTLTKASWISANDIPNGWKWENAWDYSADISKDVNRAKEMLYNVKQYAQENPQLFKNYETYKKYFHYDARDPSQQKVLDAAFKNYNKYWLNSTENKVADDASQLAADKGNEKIRIAMEWYNKRAANLQSIYDTMNPKYQNLIDKYDNLYEKAFNELDELKKMAKEYYAHTKSMYDEQSAGEAAGVESRLSAQWLGYTAIGSATTWVGNQWAKRYNNLMKNHLETLMELQDKWATIQTTLLNWMEWLTDKQAWILKDYMTGLNDLWNEVEKQQQAAADWVYAPYEEITGKKVTDTAEAAGKQAWKDATESNYMAGNTASKVKILIDNLAVDDNVELTWDYEAILREIATQYPNDISKAISAAKAKFSTLNKKTTTSTKWWWTSPSLVEILAQFPNATYEQVSKLNPKITKEEYEKAIKQEIPETPKPETNPDLDNIVNEYNNWTWDIIL